MFSLWLSLFIFSGSIFPLFSSSILGIYWLGEFTIQCHIFLPFDTVHGVLIQEYWSGLPFPSPMDHVLSELSTITRLSWVVLPDMAHSFIELDKAEILVISLGNFLWFVVFTLSSLWWIRVGGLLSLPDGRDWLWGNLGLALLGRAILSKSLNQFSVDGEASFPLCSLAWGQTVVGAMAIMATSFKKIYASMLGLQDCYIQFSSRPLSACASSGDCWALTGKSGTVCSFFLGPGMHKVLFMPHHRATRHLSPTYTATQETIHRLENNYTKAVLILLQKF